MVVPPHAVPRGVSLGHAEKLAYRRLADALLQTALREYDAFTVDNPARRVSQHDWKLVKARDGIAVYKERHAARGRARDAPFVPRLLTADGRVERVESNISVPQMLATGTMRGTVDDVVYGAFVDGPEAHAKRGYYIHDRSSDFRVLARVDSPSEDDPFRFCGLTWTEMGGAGVPFVKRRDLLTLVASGVVTRRGGDRVGYYIIHSVSHPQVKPLTEYKLLRAKTSFCYLFSEPPPMGRMGGTGNQVETFQKGFFAPLGDVPELGVTSAVVRTLLTPQLLVDSGNNRKLCCTLKHAPSGSVASRKGTHADDQQGDSDAGGDDGDDGCAGGCSRRRSDSFFGSTGASGSSLSKVTTPPPNQGVCLICKLNVCATCKVVKKLAVDAVGYDLEVKSLNFCLVCLNKYKTLSAALFARQELVARSNARDRDARGASFSSDDSGAARRVASPPATEMPLFAAQEHKVTLVNVGVRRDRIGSADYYSGDEATSSKRSPQAEIAKHPAKHHHERSPAALNRSVSVGEKAASAGADRRRAPQPGKSQHSPWQPQPKLERMQSSPQRATPSLTPKRQATPAAPRKRVDERTAIEDITRHGILL